MRLDSWTLGSVVAVCALLAIANRRGDVLAALGIGNTVALDDGSDELGQGGGLLELSLAAIDPATYLAGSSSSSSDDIVSDPSPTYDVAPQTQAQANRAAFLQMIRASEGTSGPDGYRTLFGYRTFSSFADHPRIAVQFTSQEGKTLWTTAAGAYQLMAISPIPTGGSTKVDTWDRLQRKLQLPDFTPASQDAAALELVDECGALGNVDAGELDQAVSKCRRVWASMPGAGYGQPERSLDTLRTAFVNAGGTLAA